MYAINYKYEQTIAIADNICNCGSNSAFVVLKSKSKSMNKFDRFLVCCDCGNNTFANNAFKNFNAVPLEARLSI